MRRLKLTCVPGRWTARDGRRAQLSFDECRAVHAALTRVPGPSVARPVVRCVERGLRTATATCLATTSLCLADRHETLSGHSQPCLPTRHQLVVPGDLCLPTRQSRYTVSRWMI